LKQMDRVRDEKDAGVRERRGDRVSKRDRQRARERVCERE